MTILEFVKLDGLSFLVPGEKLLRVVENKDDRTDEVIWVVYVAGSNQPYLVKKDSMSHRTLS